jgi:hypothetical protein
MAGLMAHFGSCLEVHGTPELRYDERQRIDHLAAVAAVQLALHVRAGRFGNVDATPRDAVGSYPDCHDEVPRCLVLARVRELGCAAPNGLAKGALVPARLVTGIADAHRQWRRHGGMKGRRRRQGEGSGDERSHEELLE